MIHISKIPLLSLFLLLVITACSTSPASTSSPVTPSPTDTTTPLPIHPTSTSTATQVPPTEAPAPPLNSIQMLDEATGWAWSTDGRLLRTSDGGRTWIDHTPEGYQYTGNGYFLNTQEAWLPSYQADSNRFGLLYTADGGASWVEYPEGPASGLHFTDSLNGWAVSGDVGAGNVYFHLSQTSDGGKTWAPIPVKPPIPEADLPAGIIHLCNICNDAFYYDPQRQVIVYGDLGSMEPTGYVSLEVSFDLGAAWLKLSLPLPQGESGALVAPNPPVFFTDKEGFLPIHLLKMNPDGSYGEQRMVFYATQDGGESWSQLPTVLDAVPLFRSIQVAATGDVYLICGNTLCVSHDQARTWQRLSSDLDFSSTDTRTVTAIDFVDASTGWILVMDNEATTLYQTSDGGMHWAEVSPLLLPGNPSPVTIDTSIPTPTPIPTPTLEATPTPDVAYDPQAKADRITFAPYATWVEINGSLTSGASKRYVLSAMQYQVMSVSIRQGAPFTVEVTGADNKPLTDAKNPQFYWRGGLPSTQDYYVTVTSQVSGPFTLRIAINPPGLAEQYFEFYDSQYFVALGYSDEFAPVDWGLPVATIGAPLVTLYFIEPSFYYPTTNLNEAALVLSATADPAIVSTCSQPSAQSGETVIGKVTINGYVFTHSEFTGAAAGNRYEQDIYRTVWQDKCFEVIFLIHSSNIQNYPAGTVVEFDRERLLHKLEEVLDTFSAK